MRRADVACCASSAGVTLVELLVVLVLLSLLLGVPGLARGALGAPREAARPRALVAARAEAIRTGRSVPVRVDSMVVQFFPDGRAVGQGVDPLTGVPNAAR